MSLMLQPELNHDTAEAQLRKQWVVPPVEQAAADTCMVHPVAGNLAVHVFDVRYHQWRLHTPLLQVSCASKQAAEDTCMVRG